MTSASGIAGNIALHLRANARSFPDRTALIFPLRPGAPAPGAFGRKTYREIDEASDACARGFQDIGITKGTKTILMVRPGPELFTVLFALFKVGATCVIVDPGMGIERMLHCFAAVGAEAFIGIPLAHVVRVLRPKAFSTLKAHVTVGDRRWLWGGSTLEELAIGRGEAFPIAEADDDDLLTISFTTGSTGPAKGVELTQGMAEATLRQLVAQAGRSPCVTLATLPLLGVYDLLAGHTVVLPPMDPTKPALVDARRMVEVINAFQVTHMFASPAFLHRVGGYAREAALTLPSLQAVISGGAPVAAAIVEGFRALLSPSARLECTYGATEVLPITSIESGEILGETRALTQAGKGTCIGRPVGEIEIRLMAISDGPVASWSDELFTPPGEVGEILVCGPNVSARYHQNPTANALMKVADGDRLWHRTGDLGWVDESGRIWFCGRKAQRVRSARGPLFTVQWEGVFNAHPDVYRSALVGVGAAGRAEPVLCVELRRRESAARRAQIAQELLQRAAGNPLTRDLKAVLFHPSFPVDIRHNAKIGREELARWAEAQLGHAPREDRRAAWVRVVPLAGWAFIAFGLLWPFDHALLRAAWLLTIFLSVGVHGLQLFVSWPRARRAGYSGPTTVLCTLAFGATWWKLITPLCLGAYPATSAEGRHA